MSETGRSVCLSVITPCLNGSRFIDGFFSAFERQNVNAGRYEIVVVDNGSEDDSFRILQGYAEKLGHVHVYQFIGKRGSYAARNFAIAQSNGAILAFTDIDCLPTDQWLGGILDRKDELMGGRLIAGPVELFSERSKPNVFESYDLLINLNQEQYVKRNLGVTANLVVSRPVFDEVEGFAEVGSGGDFDFCRRCAERGYQVYFEKALRVRHPAIRSFAGLIAKEKRKGQGIAEIFSISQSNRTTTVRYVALQVLGLFLQPFQWRHIASVMRSDGIRIESIRLAALILQLGWIHRWAILKTLLFQPLPAPTNSPSIRKRKNSGNR